MDVTWAEVCPVLICIPLDCLNLSNLLAEFFYQIQLDFHAMDCQMEVCLNQITLESHHISRLKTQSCVNRKISSFRLESSNNGNWAN